MFNVKIVILFLRSLKNAVSIYSNSIFSFFLFYKTTLAQPESPKKIFCFHPFLSG